MNTTSSIEEALRRSDQRYRSLVENLPNSVVILFDRDHKFLLVDGPEVDATGYSKTAMEGKLPKECLPPEFAAVVDQNFQAVLDGKRFQMELPFADRIYLYEYVPLRNGDGAVEYGLVVGQNVTRQHRSDAALRASELRFRALFEAAPDAFVLHDHAGRVLDGNAAAETLFGVKRADVIGRSILELGKFSPESTVRLFEARNRIQGEEKVGPIELVMFRGNDTIEIEIKAVPLQLDVDKVVLVAIRDVTERNKAAKTRQQLEEQLRQASKMEAIGRLAGGIAHDFNNLLTAILVNVELTMDALGADDPRYGDLDEAMHATRRATELAAQLLVFSRKQKIDPTVVELGEAVAACGRFVTRLLGATVTLSVARCGPLWIKVDVGKLEQVLVNLAVNARDAMPGGGELTFNLSEIDGVPISAHHPAVSGRHALISVTDTGQGMDAHTMEHLFEPFFTTKPATKGTGLGLSIVYGIVSQSGGHIRVRSDVGAGSTFELYFPLVEAPS